MADLDQLYTALRNADKAGDVEGAKKIASYIQSVQSQPQAIPQQPQQPQQPLPIGQAGFAPAFQQTMEEVSPMARKFAAFGSFPRYLYEGAKQLIGREDKPAIEAQRQLQAREPGAALLGGVATALPLAAIPGAGTIAGQAAIGAGIGALTPADSLKERAANIALNAATAGGASAAIKGAGMLAAPIIRKGAQRVASLAEENAVRNETIDLAHKAGLRLPPSAIGRGEVAEQLESVGMRGAVARDFSRFNQPKVNAVARQEAGLPPGQRINEATLAQARERLAQPYREVASLSTRAKTALDELGDARKDARDAWNAYKRGPGGPAERKAAEAADAKVDDLEKELELEAKRYNRPMLAQRLSQSRVAIAKNYNVLAALNKGSGNVDARVFGRLLDRKGSQAITGGLQVLGRVAEAFPSYVNEGAAGTSRASGYGVVKPAAALALGAGGYGVGEHYGIGPWGLAAGVVPLLSGPARAIALSRLMQGAQTYSPGLAARMAQGATGDLAQRFFPLEITSGLGTGGMQDVPPK